MSNNDYIGLCISSGGIKGILILGALNYYYITNQLDKIKYYAGTSVGSIIITLISLGYTPMELLAFTCSDELNRPLRTLNIMNITNIHGIYHNKILHDFIEEKIKLKSGGKSPTFFEYYKESGKYLIIPVYCLSEPVEKRKIYCSPDDTPDMKIVDAIILSCNIPIIFQKAVYKDKVYIDGAYTSNFPVESLNERITFNENTDEYKVLGININHTEFDLNNLTDYILAIQSIPLTEQDNILYKDENVDIINLDCPKDISFINFKLSSSKKSDLFNNGYFQVKNLLKSKNN